LTPDKIHYLQFRTRQNYQSIIIILFEEHLAYHFLDKSNTIDLSKKKNNLCRFTYNKGVLDDRRLADGSRGGGEGDDKGHAEDGGRHGSHEQQLRCSYFCYKMANTPLG